MKSCLIFNGGLGNQMFLYCFYLYLKKRGYDIAIDISLYNMITMHNGYELDKVFNIKEEIINKKNIHLLTLRIILHFHPYFLLCREDLSKHPSNYNFNRLYIDGYWQDEEYFHELKDDIKNIFVFRNIDMDNKQMADEMSNCNSISIHIRRGDYLQFPDFLGICDEHYYYSAIDYCNKHIKNPFYYIFSNDIEWCKGFFKKNFGEIRYKIISKNKGKNSYKDMYLMSQCKHNIIANSSFSWWGAYLKKNKGITICPKKWSNSEFQPKLIKDDWIKF